MNEQNHEPNHPSGCLLRIFWMAIGNLIVLWSAYAIAQHRIAVLGVADAFYWAAVGALLAARYVDIRHLGGTLADGDPATMAHWRRYATGLVAICAGVWLAAHGIAYLGA